MGWTNVHPSFKIALKKLFHIDSEVWGLKILRAEVLGYFWKILCTDFFSKSRVFLLLCAENFNFFILNNRILNEHAL